MKKIMLILVSISILSCNNSIVNRDKLIETIERAYFEGQKDALDGDVRIKKNIDSCWIWSSSPWDGGLPPKFDPSYECN